MNPLIGAWNASSPIMLKLAINPSIVILPSRMDNKDIDGTMLKLGCIYVLQGQGPNRSLEIERCIQGYKVHNLAHG